MISNNGGGNNGGGKIISSLHTIKRNSFSSSRPSEHRYFMEHKSQRNMQRSFSMRPKELGTHVLKDRGRRQACQWVGFGIGTVVIKYEPDYHYR